jgi:hypothetical protein
MEFLITYLLALSHSHTHSITHTHALTHTHSLIHSHTHSRTHPLTHSLTPHSAVQLEKLTGLQPVRNSSHFTEHEGSLPHSQVPDTCPYSEPAQSSPHPLSHLLKIYPPIYAWVYPLVYFPKVSPPKPYTALSPPHPHYMPHPSYFSRFYHPHNIGSAVQTMKLLIMFYQLPC